MRVGFTLIETITAITLTAIVVTLAGTALGAASDARDRSELHQGTLEAESRFRVQLTDMLRHAPRADAVQEPMLQITPDGMAGGGSTVVFLSQGVVQPFGTGAIWRVTLSGGIDGVSMRAEPIASADVSATIQGELYSVLPHLRSVRALVLEADANTSANASWRTDWPVQQSRPAVMRLDFVPVEIARDARDAAGLVPRAPLVVDLDPVRAPFTATGARP